MDSADDDTVDRQVGPVIVVSRHGCQRKRVRSVTRRREDSCRCVISIANVTDDVGKDDFLSAADGNSCAKLSSEGDICGREFNYE